MLLWFAVLTLVSSLGHNLDAGKEFIPLDFRTSRLPFQPYTSSPFLVRSFTVCVDKILPPPLNGVQVERRSSGRSGERVCVCLTTLLHTVIGPLRILGPTTGSSRSVTVVRLSTLHRSNRPNCGSQEPECGFL